MSSVAIALVVSAFVAAPILSRVGRALEQRRLRAALSSGESLSALIFKIESTKTYAQRSLQRRPAKDGDRRVEILQELDALIALAHLEEGAYVTAISVLHGRSRWAPFVHSRRELLEGSTQPLFLFEGRLGSLGALLDSDSQAQLSLARDLPVTADAIVLPTTRARVLARAQRMEEALRLLASIAPERVAALIARTPNDPLTRAWLTRGASPYR